MKRANWDSCSCTHFGDLQLQIYHSDTTFSEQGYPRTRRRPEEPTRSVHGVGSCRFVFLIIFSLMNFGATWKPCILLEYPEVEP